MGLNEVINEVTESGARRAQQIVDDAQAEASEILAAAASAAADYQAKREADAEREAQQVRAQVASRAEFEARKMVLEAEAALRGELRKMVLDGFAKLSPAKRKGHLASLLAQAKAVIPSGRVWCAAKDKKALEDQKTFDFAGTTDIVGGIVVEDKSGKNRLDLSYETLLDAMWRDILRNEAQLFKGT